MSYKKDMTRHSRHSWVGYLNLLKHRHFDPDPVEQHQIKIVIRQLNQNYNRLFSNGHSVLYLNDYRNSSYSVMSRSAKALMGYSADRFTDGGVAHSLSIFHPDDLKLFNEQIFPERMQFLKSIAPLDHPNYTFSYNYRVKTPRGNYVSLLQRNSIIRSDEAGNPLLSLGILTDITNYADPNKIIHTIDKVATYGQEEHLKKISCKNYFLNRNGSLSSREKEVLLLMADGLTSKEIADKLHISEYTVINHKRSMQEKTNTNNATGLIAYALKNDLI